MEALMLSRLWPRSAMSLCRNNMVDLVILDALHAMDKRCVSKSYLNLPGELDLIADVKVDAEVQKLADALIIPASEHFGQKLAI